MMNYDLFVAAVRNAKDAEDTRTLTREEFEDIRSNGSMYHQYEDISVLFYQTCLDQTYLGDAVCMTVDGDETYKFESYQVYRDFIDNMNKDC